jgi:hypothetical protein
MSGTAFISIRYEINNPQVFQLPLLSGTMIHIHMMQSHSGYQL